MLEGKSQVASHPLLCQGTAVFLMENFSRRMMYSVLHFRTMETVWKVVWMKKD